MDSRKGNEQEGEILYLYHLLYMYHHTKPNMQKVSNMQKLIILSNDLANRRHIGEMRGYCGIRKRKAKEEYISRILMTHTEDKKIKDLFIIAFFFYFSFRAKKKEIWKPPLIKTSMINLTSHCHKLHVLSMKRLT